VSNFRLIWILLPGIVVKRVRNSTARFRCVFGSTDGPLNVRRILRTWLCAKFPYLNYMKPFRTLPYPRLSFARFR
jgi:hypothetical protein